MPPVGWQLYVDDAAPQAPMNLPAVRSTTDVIAPEPRPATLELPPVTGTQSLPPTAAPPPPPQVAPAVEPGVLWAATGQPITGIGAGRYRLTATMLYFERGVLSTNAQQVPIGDVVDVDLRQSITQKARGVGNVMVKVQRSNGFELVVLEDIPEPRKAVSIINETVHAARLAQQERMNTRHYSGAPAMVPQPPAAPAVPSAPPQVDPIAQLRQLGELRDAGILTEEEFAAKKAEILSRL